MRIALLSCLVPIVSIATATLARADVSLPVDLSELRDSEKSAFSRMLAKYPSACGKPHSLEVSLRTDPKCKRSVFAARYIARLFREHFLPSEVEEHYEERFGNQPPAKIDVARSPVRGDVAAPVTMVEFADFQCAHCKKFSPILERVLDEYRGQVRLIFKNYPITSAHPDAANAAAAALAAGKQGKFWPFHDRLFGGDQDRMDMTVLEKHARELKLDLKKWRADIETVRADVQKDREDGEAVSIRATPTLFINGRQFRGPHTFEEVKDWIEEELNR